MSLLLSPIKRRIQNLDNQKRKGSWLSILEHIKSTSSSKSVLEDKRRSTSYQSCCSIIKKKP